MTNTKQAIKNSETSNRQSKIPTVEKTKDRITVIFNNEIIAETNHPVLVKEPGLPPVYYIPEEDVKMEALQSSDRQTHCPWKGDAEYFHVSLNGTVARNTAWRYPNPKKRFMKGKDHLSFYPSKLEACYINGKKVRLQEDGFFAGWVSEVEGG